MKQYDRLTTLIERFKLEVSPSSPNEANLIALGSAAGVGLDRIIFFTNRSIYNPPSSGILFSAQVDWGGSENPLLKTLPKIIEIDLKTDKEALGLVNLMKSEILGIRCGMNSVLNRLSEVLIIRMMRSEIEKGSTQPGLLSGLSDNKISRAIVAMHDRPGRSWRNEHLAEIAGMSLSRFAETFLLKVGLPPASYLRHWRLVLARQDLSDGQRVDLVARRYGFSSTEGFTRAFKKQYGTTPIKIRPRNQASGKHTL